MEAETVSQWMGSFQPARAERSSQALQTTDDADRMTSVAPLPVVPLPMFDFHLSQSQFAPHEAAVLFVLQAFGHDLRRCEVERPAEAHGFSGAVIFRVRDGQQTWCLRRWPGGGMTSPRLLVLHHFLRHLKTCGISVLAQPTATLRGETVVEHESLLWQLEPWLPGRADFHQQPSLRRLHSAMQTLAQIHRAAERYDCPRAGRRWFSRHPAAPSPACRERLQIVRDWTKSRCDQARTDLERKAPAEFRRLALDILRDFQVACGPVERELRFLHDLPLPVHPCLRDIWHDHVLFSGEEVTGVIDPSAARTENVAADLSRLLGSLLEDDRPQWETALAAYQGVRPLSREERRLITALDRSSVLLSGLTWIDRCLREDLDDDSLPRVLLRVETIHRRLTRLVDSVTL